ncbi:DUF3267 domain-containing protein [Guptibacillus algicola]|uniref:DUF3267 domain-containing protein n=1 Tax=Guptibacillus algicola TaxID=225844 RepID=UPI001CD44291|nr:DUF3267 domain-containing protein [Alkalihalobacillus algicola]MCA0989192.1 DUF3267 domain-containing protein [Alkalihalobacillus algicola]
MNCWKSIYLNREFGVHRLTIFSTLLTLLYFIAFYLTFSMFYPKTEHAIVPILPFLGSLAILFPIHKLLHWLPLTFAGMKATMRLEKGMAIVPKMHCETCNPISRNLYLTAALSPAIVITAAAIGFSIAMPSYVSFFSILAAINLGFSFSDFLYASQVFKAPRHAFVEDRSEGFHILIKRAS